jgi:hypothetical protein
MSRIKVCHLTVTHSENDNRIFQNECKTLIKEGYDISIIVPNVEDKILEGINIIGIKCNMQPLSRVFVGAGKVYKKALEVDADIYHIHDIELFRYGVKLKRKGKKVIFDSHEDWLMYANDITWMPGLIKKLISGYLRRLYKKNLGYFDAVITVSPHILEKIEQYTSHAYTVSYTHLTLPTN